MDYTYKTANLPKSVVQLLIEIPWDVISREYDIAFDALAADLEIEGYRRGKAPKAMAQKHIKQEIVYDKLVRTLFSRIYQEIVDKDGLKPVVAPRIDIKKAKEKEVWEVEMLVAQKPTIDLSTYKAEIGKMKKDKKGEDIWVPGQDEKAAASPDESAKKQKMLNNVLETLSKAVSIEIADMIVEEEVESRLARLVDDVQKVGMTIDAYVKSKNMTMDELKAAYQREVEEMYKMEFILNEIADVENIQVEQEEIDALMSSAKDEKEREAAAKNLYYYVMILRKQKVLDYLLAL